MGPLREGRDSITRERQFRPACLIAEGGFADRNGDCGLARTGEYQRADEGRVLMAALERVTNTGRFERVSDRLGDHETSGPRSARPPRAAGAEETPGARPRQEQETLMRSLRTSVAAVWLLAIAPAVAGAQSAT